MPGVTRLSLVGFLVGGVASAVAAQNRQVPAAINRAYLDTTCSPCTDFYRFANGAWLDSVIIPKDWDRWGPREELRQRNSALVRQILNSLAYAPQRQARTSVERKVGTFYRACMDSTVPPSVGLGALEPELRRIAAIRARRDLAGVVGRLQRHRVLAVFWLVDGPDLNDPNWVVAGARLTGGWTLPLRQTYLAADSASARTRAAYVTMLAGLFEALGDLPDTAVLVARRVLSFETALAGSRQVDSDSIKNFSLADLERLAPAFGWRSFARELGRPDLASLNTRATIVRTIDSLATSVPLAEWKAYLRWRLLFEVARDIDPVRNATGPFFRMLSGRQQDPPRIERCGFLTTFWLGDGVGRAFVSRTFSPEARAAARAMAEQIREVLRERIAALDWLGATSRSRALAKLNAMQLWIGYPDRWEDYDDLEVRDGAATANLLSARRYITDRRMAIVGTRLDRTRWTEANPAFYDVSDYTVTVATLATAAALLPPFFDPNGDPAVNYAAAGSGIGHELSHAFDSNGRLYNEIGKREDWWTPDEVREFNRRADLIVKQYDEFVIVDTIRQNGRMTLSENLSDIGGITLAWLAFQRAIQGRSREIIDGFTSEQRFFIAYAQVLYRQARRPELVRLQAQNDMHSAPQWRVNGPLAHLPAFAAAFDCKEGDAMVRPVSQRWTVW